MSAFCRKNHPSPPLTNRVPNSIESAHIQAEIEGLLKEKAQLEIQLNEINKALGDKRALLSSLRRFPTEVLGEVFGVMIPSVLDDIGRQQLVSLQLVCRSWREAALVTNRLWSGIEVSPLHDAGTYEKIATWLGRSGSVAKSLHWNPGSTSRDVGCCLAPREHRSAEECDLATSVVATLLVWGPQVDHLKLNCEHADCFRHLVRTIQTSGESSKPRPWEALQSIAVIFQDSWSDWIDPLEPEGGPLLHLLPPVASLGVQFPTDMGIFSGVLVDFHLAFEQAKRAVIDIPLRVLGHLTALKFTSPYFPASDNEDDLGRQFRRTSPILLPNVHTLHCRAIGSLSILEYIKLPRLLSLDIGMFDHDDDPLEPSDFSAPVAYFAKQSGVVHSLRTLRLHGVKPFSECLIRVLYAFPSLNHLILDRVTVDWGDLFRSPGLDGSDSPPVPQSVEKLEILQVPPDFPVDPLLDLFAIHPSDKQRHITLSYGDCYATPWSEADFDDGMAFREMPKMKVSILPPVRDPMEDR